MRDAQGRLPAQDSIFRKKEMSAAANMANTGTCVPKIIPANPSPRTKGRKGRARTLTGTEYSGIS